MTAVLVNRTLWFQDEGKRKVVDQSFLTSDSRSLVVLGEAGMGKSTLLNQLRGQLGYEVCTARALITAPDTIARFGRAQTLVIDALDEVSAGQQGDAVDLVLNRLGVLGYPRFILSCRVADWRSATALQGLSDLYGEAPVELYLEPLNRQDAVEVLSQRLGDDAAENAAVSLEAQGLSGLWSNPQTLSLVREVLGHGALPTSRGGLFEAATNLLRKEHRDEKIGAKLSGLGEDAVLDAAGAAFATLILTGQEAVTLRVNANAEDVPLSAIAELPNAGAIRDILDSRLFVALSSDRFTYSHRSMGEFLGARWLARCADTPRKQRRLLGLFNAPNLVPTSLRGLHAWIAWHSTELAGDIIAANPMGVIQYGDGDNLTLASATRLLDALEALAAKDPWFWDWSDYRLSGLAQLPLLPRLKAIITSAEREFGLRLLVLQAVKGSAVLSTLVDELEALLLAPDTAFALRSEAADRLHELGPSRNWPAIVEHLLTQGDEDAIRLGVEILELADYAGFSDDVIGRVVTAQLGLENRTIGILYRLQRKLPTDRIGPLLDAIAVAASAVEDEPHDRLPHYTDLAQALLGRLLVDQAVAPEQLWRWLEPLGRHEGYQRDARDAVAERLRADDGLRRAVQRRALIDQPVDGNLWRAAFRLSERSPGLTPDQGDIIALLDLLAPDDPRWRDVVSIARHSADEGAAVRQAARRFAAGAPEDEAWLDKLEHPDTPEWQVDQDSRRSAREAKKLAEWEKHRAGFLSEIDELRAGTFRLIVNPAKAYLKLFADMGDETLDGPGRLQEWLGPELRDAGLAGFEAFLSSTPVKPSAVEIAESHADDKRWTAAYVIVAALIERHRTGRGFADLPTERVMAGLMEIRSSRIDDHAGVPDLDRILGDELRRRGAWEEALRLYFEPQLKRGRTHIDGLYGLMRETQDSSLATRFAVEWLERFKEMSPATEAELVDHLLPVPEAREELSAIALERRARAFPDAERRLIWDTVGLLIDFERTRAELEAGGDLSPELLWHMRTRIGSRREQGRQVELKPELALWLLRRFRIQFPRRSRPEGMSTGDDNDWNASEFISALIKRLASDVSDEAVAAMAQLLGDRQDPYTELVRSASAEQERNRVEARWRAPDPKAVSAVVRDGAPTTALQLQAVLLEELGEVQRKLRSSDVDWYRDFIDHGVPRGEEDCRDSLLKMVRPLPFGIDAQPEAHLADDKRCDIFCQLGDLGVPIEIKGQWHRDLWVSADAQLGHLYAHDWRAEAGIYLVLWFGEGTSKPLKAPPAREPKPTTAAELREALIARSAQAGTGRVAIVVLDFERPA
ncbi:NACHT domain-containing protein [Brevundimonas sp. R86498]|uniref:NACHT domain-containing protein n=1 Tax=Brevundimonas sp. R86498 TaxID=3093845 RepID=UPI0037CAC75B